MLVIIVHNSLHTSNYSDILDHKYFDLIGLHGGIYMCISHA